MRSGTKQKFIILLPVMICLLYIVGTGYFWMEKYAQMEFSHVSNLCQIILKENPEMEDGILSSLKTYCTADYTVLKEVPIQNTADFLEQYGYRSSDFPENRQTFSLLILFSAAGFLVVTCGFLFSVRCLFRQNRQRINELTGYLEQVNMGAAGSVLQPREDEFAHLQDELYKTVTELRQTRDNAVKAKVNFADNLANIAHQLKTPITASFLSLQLMRKKAPNIYGEQIEKQLRRLNLLEEALLTLSKIDAGTLLLESAPVDIYTALNLAADNLRDLLEKEHISVSVPDRGCVEIKGDLEWMMEALMNLMKNCMEHSRREGTIYCDYSSNPLYAEILIWDEGPGFDPEDIPHLFDRFYRGKGASANGAGIGLALARSIFELQNGSISARNLPEGGACFEIRIYCH